MTPIEFANVKPLLDEMIADTDSGKMKWRRISPTSFSWTKTSSDGRLEGQVTLQKTQQRKNVIHAGPPARALVEVVDNFVLQVTDPSVGTIKLTINTQQDAEAREVLQRLYTAISTKADQDAVDFLKKILSP